MTATLVNFEIRHLDELIQLFNESIRNTCWHNQILDEPLVLSEINDKVEKAKKYLERRLPNEFMICGMHSSRIVAVGGCFACGSDIASNCDDLEADAIEIGSIYVHPAFQRLGYGKAIFGELIGRLQKAGVRRAFVDSGYRSSQEYWSKVLGQPRLDLESNFGPKFRYMIWEIEFRNIGR